MLLLGLSAKRDGMTPLKLRKNQKNDGLLRSYKKQIIFVAAQGTRHK